MTPEDPAPLHLLLVEDEAAYRAVVAERLTEIGYKVAQAGTGEEALDRLNGFAFDILLTDLRLPGVDGRHDAQPADSDAPGGTR